MDFIDLGAVLGWKFRRRVAACGKRIRRELRPYKKALDLWILQGAKSKEQGARSKEQGWI